MKVSPTVAPYTGFQKLILLLVLLDLLQAVEFSDLRHN